MILSCTVQLRWHATVYLRQYVVHGRLHPCIGPARALCYYKIKHYTKLPLRAIHQSVSYLPPQKSLFHHTYFYSTQSGKNDDLKNEGVGEKKLSISQEFKQMYRDYCGVDVAAILTNMGFSEKITSPLKDSKAGHFAVACALFKIATPARYTVTLGTINHPVSLPLQKSFFYHKCFYCTKSGKKDDLKYEGDGEKKLSLLQRFKQMYRDYWYVLVPVHVATSIMWFGGFYYMAKSGVDVAAILTNMGFSEKITSPLKDSSAGYLAVAYAMYKIATPARYTVTLGGTTVSINYLKRWGYIKPIPPKEKLKEMYAEKKESVVGSYREKKDSMVESYRERKESVVVSYREKKESVRSGLQEAKDSITQGLRQGLGSKNETKEKDLPGFKGKDCGTKS